MRIRNGSCRSGVAAMEFAAVLPIVLVLLLGIWEAGRLIDVNQILSNACREGARQAATGLVSNSQVQQTVLTYLQNQGVPTGNAVVTVTDVTSPGTDAQNATELDQFQVTVTIPVGDVRWVALNYITTASSTISAQATWDSEKDHQYPTTISPPPGF